jgi:cyclin A
MVCKELGTSSRPDIVDIDSNLKDPKACSSYASDIHSYIRVAEVCTASSIHFNFTYC